MSTNPSWNSIDAEIVNSADAIGTYPDEATLESLTGYIQAGARRVNVATAISSNFTKIIKEAMVRNYSLANKLNHAARQYSACMRDLDYFLRQITYVILVGELSILDERVLNGLAETYTALGISLEATVKFIRTMQEVTASIINHEDLHVINEVFDYLCNQLMVRSQNISSETFAYKTSSADGKSWEPKNYEEWLERDKLAQQIRQDRIEDLSLDDSAEDFFEALIHTPYELRKQVWREREVMAALHLNLTTWQKIPGFLSISVGRRDIGGKNKLVGIINFVHGTPLESIHNKISIPSLINVDSCITELKESEKEIPVILESSSIPVCHSSQAKLDTISSVSSTTLAIQSGDKIAGRGSNGSESSRVTLSTFVIPKEDLANSNIVLPHILTVRHGFSGYTDINTCEPQVHLKIGELVAAANSHGQSLAEKLDVALVRLSTEQECIIKPYLRWVDECPKRPIPIVSSMPVQMFGGTSEHELGTVDESMIIYPGPNQSIIPDFSVNISSQPGDSGSLLVVGHHSKVPVPEFLEEVISDDWNNLVYSMQGVLLAASIGTIYGNKVIFRPMITILHWLRLQPYLP